MSELGHGVRVQVEDNGVTVDLPRRPYTLTALEALYLAGQVMAGGLQVIARHHGGAGPFPEGEAGIFLWEKWGDMWNPTLRLRTVEEIEREVKRAQAEGIPYMVALELTVDPLDPKPYQPKGASR